MGRTARTSMSARREQRSASRPAPTTPAATSAAAGTASPWYGDLYHAAPPSSQTQCDRSNKFIPVRRSPILSPDKGRQAEMMSCVAK